MQKRQKHVCKGLTIAQDKAGRGGAEVLQSDYIYGLSFTVFELVYVKGQQDEPLLCPVGLP